MGNCAYKHTSALKLESIHISVEQALWVNASSVVIIVNNPSRCIFGPFTSCEKLYGARASFHAIAGWVNFGEVTLLIMCSLGGMGNTRGGSLTA
jgi:hypothetical protein